MHHHLTSSTGKMTRKSFCVLSESMRVTTIQSSNSIWKKKKKITQLSTWPFTRTCDLENRANVSGGYHCAKFKRSSSTTADKIPVAAEALALIITQTCKICHPSQHGRHAMSENKHGRSKVGKNNSKRGQWQRSPCTYTLQIRVTCSPPPPPPASGSNVEAALFGWMTTVHGDLSLPHRRLLSR